MRGRWISMFDAAVLAVLATVGSAGCGGSGGGGGTPSSNADLASLVVSTGTLVPAFAAGTTTYAVGPSILDSTVRVTATAADGGAAIAVNGVPTASGTPSAPIALPFGITPVTVAVAASDGTTTRTYTLVFTRAAPSAQQAYVKASNTDADDVLGFHSAISGNTLVVGARGESSSATGVNPGPAAEADDSASGAGAVYVFVRTGSTWTQQAYVKASNTDADDAFGNGIAISGDTLVVAAPAEDSNATGVNPGAAAEADDSAGQSGAVYVFVRTGSTWTQQAYLKASNTDADDAFGNGIAISGDTLVVAAPSEDSNATGVNPGAAAEADDSAAEAGAVYVFVRTGSTWTQQAYLKASNTGAGDFFGSSVAVDGDTIVVGAPGENSNATGVNPGPAAEADDSAFDAGAAYVFVRSGSTWTQQAYVKASNTDVEDGFGAAVAVAGNTIVVGASEEDGNATGVNPGPVAEADDSAADAGAAYVFVRSGVVWTQQAYVKASNTDAGDGFGFPVALSGETLVVGALAEASSATGVNPGPAAEADDSAPRAGAAYVFVRSGVVWTQQAYVKASNTDADDQFPRSLGIAGDTFVAGANNESSNATGVNPGPVAEADDSASIAGAAYVFSRTGAVWRQIAYLKASNTDAGDRFGVSSGISGDTIVVGANAEASNATGVNPGPVAEADDSAPFAGALYVFR